MTDQLYDEREDEQHDQEAARGETEAEEEGKPYAGEQEQPGGDEQSDF
jgi:hypothetical protein